MTTRLAGRLLILTMLALLAAGVTAFAHERDLTRGGRIGGPDGRGPGGGFLARLIFPCRAECNDDARDCADNVASDAVTCAERACAAEIAAAQTACQADRSSDECRTARTALATCGATCLDTARAGASACRDAFDECVAACGNG